MYLIFYCVMRIAWSLIYLGKSTANNMYVNSNITKEKSFLFHRKKWIYFGKKKTNKEQCVLPYVVRCYKTRTRLSITNTK